MKRIKISLFGGYSMKALRFFFKVVVLIVYLPAAVLSAVFEIPEDFEMGRHAGTGGGGKVSGNPDAWKSSLL